MMNKLSSFLEKMLSSQSGTSSKRFNGTYGFATFVILIIFVVLYDVLKDGKLEQLSVELLNTLSYMSTALLGLGILDKIKQK